MKASQSNSLCVSVRFLADCYHGPGDRGEPEWPPSPFRLFQSIVSAAAGKWNERGRIVKARPVLLWLEKQTPPLIVAPRVTIGANYRSYVPDNIGDQAAGSWARGNLDALVKRTEKDIQPLLFDSPNEIHYVWKLADFPPTPDWQDVFLQTVRSITHLGWGVDMVVADATFGSNKEVAELKGERWIAEAGAGDGLRTPISGSLDELERRYSAFLDRMRPDLFSPVAPLTTFARTRYAGPTARPRLSLAAFALLKGDASGFRIFNPVSNGIHVAGMLRHAAKTALGGNALADAVMGHGKEGAERVAFVPLPTIEFRGEGKARLVGSVRRALLIGVRGFPEKELMRLAQGMASQPLIEEGPEEKEAALLSRLPTSDKMITAYIGPAAQWATVTPMVLPGYDDPRGYRKRLNAAANGGEILTPQAQADLLEKLDARIEGLIRKAIVQGGFSEEMAASAVIAWNGSGFWPGTGLASHYRVPETLRRFRRVHVRIRWQDDSQNPIDVRGPICLGSGRFVGLGLFAPVE